MPINKFDYDTNLSTYDNTIIYMHNIFPDVFYREGVLFVRGVETQMISIESKHPKYNGFVIEFCDVYHISWEKQATFARCKCILTMCNHFEHIKTEINWYCSKI